MHPTLRQFAARGPVLIAIAAVCWGLAGGVGGLLIARDWDPFVVSFYRGVLTLFFAAVWLGVSRRFYGFGSIGLWAWSFLAGAGVAGAFSFYFAGMQYGSVAVAATLLYSAPVFVFLVGFLAGFERMTVGKLAGLALIVAGVALLTGFFSQASSGLSPMAVAIGLLSGLCYAAFIFGFRYASSHGSPQAVMAIAFMAECLILLAIIGEGAWARPIAGVDIGQLMLLGVVGGGVSFLLYIYGLRRSRPGLAALTAMAEPITAALFGLLVLGQTLSIRQIAGAVLVIITVTALNARYQTADG